LASKNEEVSGFKVNKERVTLMVAANASGSHKIPMTVIRKSKMAHCFRGKNIAAFPII
jgi:hypothetical protein